MKPSVGRIVHLRTGESFQGDVCLAAVITRIRSEDDDVDLFVMDAESSWHEPDVTLGVVHGSWHWPERVE